MKEADRYGDKPEEEDIYLEYEIDKGGSVEAKKAWAIGKEVGLVADEENIVIQSLLEDYIEKKKGSRGNCKKNGRGRKKSAPKKTGVFSLSP